MCLFPCIVVTLFLSSKEVALVYRAQVIKKFKRIFYIRFNYCVNRNLKYNLGILLQHPGNIF